MPVRKVTLTVEGDGEAGQAAVMRLLAAIAAGLDAERHPTNPPPLKASA